MLGLRVTIYPVGRSKESEYLTNVIHGHEQVVLSASGLHGISRCVLSEPGRILNPDQRVSPGRPPLRGTLRKRLGYATHLQGLRRPPQRNGTLEPEHEIAIRTVNDAREMHRH